MWWVLLPTLYFKIKAEGSTETSTNACRPTWNHLPECDVLYAEDWLELDISRIMKEIGCRILRWLKGHRILSCGELLSFRQYVDTDTT